MKKKNEKNSYPRIIHSPVLKNLLERWSKNRIKIFRKKYQ